MATTVFLIRHGTTDWNRDRKILGQRDIPLNDEGLAQARGVAEALSGRKISDIVSSPLVRAVRTAETIGEQFGIEVARDPRLIDFRVGKWQGMAYDQVATSPEFQQFIADPLAQRIPGGESMTDVKRRAVAAVEQALEDSPEGDDLVVVSHAGIVRVLLTHYAGASAANYHRLRVCAGSVSVLSFADDKQLPRIITVNWRPSLTDLLDSAAPALS